MTASELTACRRTGREADTDGLCPDHGAHDCVVTVIVAAPLFQCVIPGFQCTHNHDIQKVKWKPIRPL